MSQTKTNARLIRRNNFFVRSRSFLFIACGSLIIVLTGACWCTGSIAPYVVVREEQFRSENLSGDRLRLPLNADTRARLISYLKTGGDKTKEKVGTVDPDAERRYSGLLNWLQTDRTADDLSSPEAKAWLKNGPIHEVIDSRESRSLKGWQVAAVGDDNYWWIFYYPNSKHLDQLLVTRVTGAKPVEK